MPKSKIILSIGAIIALLPVLGFPHVWEAFFQILAGLAIVFLSVWVNIDKKLKLQAKAHQRQARKIASEASIASQLPEASSASAQGYGETEQANEVTTPEL